MLGRQHGESIGCRDVDGESSIVTYRYSFVGGDRLDNSTAMDVDVLTLDGAPLDSFTLTLPDQIEEALMIVEPYCNGLPVITEARSNAGSSVRAGIATLRSDASGQCAASANDPDTRNSQPAYVARAAARSE